MANWPTLTDYLCYARITDTYDDAIVTSSLAAVKAAVLHRCPMLATVVEPDVPDDVFHAMLIWTNRLVARRNSPEGIVGIGVAGDMGVVNIGRYDSDVQRLLAPYTAAVLA